MSTPFYMILVLLLSGLAASPCSAAEVGLISSLARSDSLQISFESTGCFHFHSFEITISRAQQYTAKVVEIQQQGPTAFNNEVKVNPPVRVELGELVLSHGDVAGLDGLLRFYRSKKPDGCTTTDRIAISKTHAGAVVATEQFVDQSCRSDGKNLLRIADLAHRLKTTK